MTSCLVNPRACHEAELQYTPAQSPRRVAVVGAGPAGMMAAIVAAGRGHAVTLFERAPEIGGQLRMASRIPGKEEFHGLIKWFGTMLARTGVSLALGREVDADALASFDEVIVATGVVPRDPAIPGQGLPHVASYIDILEGRVVAGPRVAIVGAGGIGFDVAEFLVEEGESPTLDRAAWRREWGVGDPRENPGGLAPAGPVPEPPARQVTLLQRKPGKLGRGLGKTTGWIHRARLEAKGVRMVGGVNYERITPEGLHLSFGEGRDKPTLIEADTIVLCAGQEPMRALADTLAERGVSVHVIGGAERAAELDAKRAIDQAARLAAQL